MNALEIVGAVDTVRVAVLLGGPGVGVCVVITPVVVFGKAPNVELVTLKITVQVPLLGILIPLKPTAVAPAVSVEGVVPVQVPVTEPPTALMFTSVSLKVPTASAVELVFDSV